ncbi:MAG TPA: cytochrome c biogenesis protein CcdA [Acidimicrobiales bacterium]|nr:cytochrome c biogenesis protein CcdA [Acidimicrobiales bacterium]
MKGLVLPLAAVVAGLVSFSSPCALPLVPGYLSYISALPVSELGTVEARAVTVRASLLFVAGFTTVFTVLGTSLAAAGSLLGRHLDGIDRIAGVGIVVLGLAMAGVLRVPWLDRERRLDLARVPSGPRAAFGVGMAFAFGWTPCIGPVLATILTTAAATRTAVWGAGLLVLYSLGLGLPFVALALGFGRARRALGILRRHGRQVELAGGVLLIAVGVLFATGVWQSLFTPLERHLSHIGWPPI